MFIMTASSLGRRALISPLIKYTSESYRPAGYVSKTQQSGNINVKSDRNWFVSLIMKYLRSQSFPDLWTAINTSDHSLFLIDEPRWQAFFMKIGCQKIPIDGDFFKLAVFIILYIKSLTFHSPSILSSYLPVLFHQSFTRGIKASPEITHVYTKLNV